MTTRSERAEILTRALFASIRHDRSAARDLYTDDVRAWTPAMAIASRDELLTEFDRRDDAFADIELDVAPLDVGGSYACVEWTVSMTHTGPLEVADGRVVDATGTRVTLHGVTVAEFRDDRICSFRQYWDELAVYQQLGLLGA